ncbi:hypothetical protein TcG_10057 [Trypanosoma cruzi]|nr:hypothetical protein TcG_10057 [Trypanosoma cruzi]
MLYSTSHHTHTRSEEEMVDLLLGNGNLRIQSCPVRLLDTTFDRLLNSVTHVSTAAKQTTPRRYQLRPVAQAGAFHHSTQSFSIGYGHVVSLYYGDAIIPCLAPTSIIRKYCTATVVKHTLALVHQRKMHLSS